MLGFINELLYNQTSEQMETTLNATNYNVLDHHHRFGGVAISSPANNQGHHISWAYLNTAGMKDSEVLKAVDSVKKATEVFAKQKFAENAPYITRINGHYSVKVDQTTPWGKNSLLLKGPIEEYSKALHAYLKMAFPSLSFGDFRPPHVDVKGKFDTPLYPTITPTQLR